MMLIVFFILIRELCETMGILPMCLLQCRIVLCFLSRYYFIIILFVIFKFILIITFISLLPSILLMWSNFLFRNFLFWLNSFLIICIFVGRLIFIFELIFVFLLISIRFFNRFILIFDTLLCLFSICCLGVHFLNRLRDWMLRRLNIIRSGIAFGWRI